MLQMLRIITPSNDPKYKQIEDQIQKLMDKMNLDKTAMSPPHPDAEYKQLMDNFILLDDMDIFNTGNDKPANILGGGILGLNF